MNYSCFQWISSAPDFLHCDVHVRRKLHWRVALLGLFKVAEGKLEKLIITLVMCIYWNNTHLYY